MKLTNKLLLSILLCIVFPAYADDAVPDAVTKLITKYESDVTQLVNSYQTKISTDTATSATNTMWENIAAAKTAPTIDTDSDDKSDSTSKDKSDDDPETAAKKKELQEQKIAELQKNYDDAKANEQSTANKLIGAAGMASVGIGGMELASGLAEKNADADAERDMRAYLETIKCDYGQGLNIKGGETNIELPGGNELAELYSQYTALAADLKARKESLGLKPGLESELILDKASTGLYDDVGIGITSGAYASVSRALMDENGDDAAAWQAQKDESQKKIKAGAIAAGVGAVGTLAANLAVNARAPKEKSAEINRKYEQALSNLKSSVSKLPENTARCPSGATGTYPNCTCSNSAPIYNTNDNTCTACPNDKTVVDNQCVCPAGKHDKNGTCVANNGVTPPCETDLEKNPHVQYNKANNTCSCNDGWQYDAASGLCLCPNTHTLDSKTDKCVVTPAETITTELSAANLFGVGESTLTPAAKAAIKEFVTDVTQKLTSTTTVLGVTTGAVVNSETTASKIAELTSNTDYCITVVGHTDRTGKSAVNQKLSLARANAVKTALTDAGLSATNIRASGQGSSACAADGNQPECRKVEIRFNPNSCAG